MTFPQIRKLNTLIVVFLAVLLTNLEVLSCQQQKKAPQLTIFVDEGHGLELNGHVFIGLSDGTNTQYAGWYAKEGVVNKILAPMSRGGGEVRDDAKLAESGWDVKKTYDISRSDYLNAKQMITTWNETGIPWGLQNHCGDFAETIARRANVRLELPERDTGRNRPGLFGDYLRKNGGTVRGSEKKADSKSNPAQACPPRSEIKSVFGVNSYVNTRIAIGRGDRITIRATGLVTFGLLAGQGSPQGIPFNPAYNYFVDLPHGCLIGRVRNTGADDEWAYVGPGTSVVSETSGILELNVNDNDPDNNVGRFRVEVSVCRTHS
jgi:hypothetical protein